MNFFSGWDAKAAARWKKWRRGGKVWFVLKGALGFGFAPMAANIPVLAVAWVFSAHAALEKSVLSIAIFALLGALIELVTWNRMESAYGDNVSRAASLRP
jgi:hypothetical protein